jgi:hypothetical protein
MPTLLEKTTKPLTWYLERGHLNALGIRNTMRLARAYNQYRYGAIATSRDNQYRDHFDKLIEENGPPRTPAIEIKDAWALDTSCTLPHLDQLIDEAEEVIKERGLQPQEKPGAYRSFFQSIVLPLENV